MSFVFFLLAVPAFAQQQQAPSPDTPSFRIGGLLYADYTYTGSLEPAARDAEGHEIHPNSFNVTRAYINVTGSLNRYLAFRITPDIARETSPSSSLSGSQEYRLKYAYAQLNLDQWLTKGSWLRGGVIPTPWIEFEESRYRYRFQGPIMVDREGYTVAADNGVAMHYALPLDVGDVVGGFYNGDSFARAEANDQKAVMVRATLVLRRLRLTGFYDLDHYAAGLPRDRAIAQVGYDGSRVTAAIDFLSARDEKTAGAPTVHARGYSAWVTPKLVGRWEALLRRDSIDPDTRVGDRRTRDIEGIAYWFPMQSGITTALMVDRDATRGPARGTRATNYGIKFLLSF